MIWIGLTSSVFKQLLQFQRSLRGSSFNRRKPRQFLLEINQTQDFPAVESLRPSPPLIGAVAEVNKPKARL